MANEQPQLGAYREPLDVEETLDRFEAAWRTGEMPRIEDYVPLGRSSPLAELNEESSNELQRQRELLGELVMLDLWYRWRRAQEGSQGAESTRMPPQPLLEDYLRRFPELGPVDQLEVALICEEYRVRRRFAGFVDKAAYFERFPTRSRELKRLLEDIDHELADDTITRYSDTAPQTTIIPKAAPAGPVAEEPPRVPETIGKYRIVAPLDEGGQATVYRALHPTLDRELVIKLARRPIRRESPEADRLIAEGKLLAELDHPNLARMYDLDLHDGRPYLVMEYVRGRNLRQYVQQHRLSPREAALLVAKIARAMDAAHARGIIHQDLKPTNILIDEAGQPRIIDFGMARLRHAWGESPVESGSVSGTLQYMPPEQARGDTDQVSHRSDIFALGAILYSLLAGRPPYTERDITTLLERASRCNFDRSPLDGVPRRLRYVCLRAMEADPADRYQNADELAAELEKAVRPRWPLPVAAGLVAVLVSAAVWFSGVVHQPDLPDYVTAPLRQDFPLEFTVLGAETNRHGSVITTEGRPVSFQVSAGKDCYVGIWLVGGTGEVTQLFPNEYERDQHVEAGKPRIIPGLDYSLQATASEGKEYLHVVASTRDWSVPAGAKQGPYVVYATASQREQWQEDVRGLVMMKDESQPVSEEIVRFIVRPE
jgi:tRNA A-37 threonylcarbamoyl transferase component Bud32